MATPAEIKTHRLINKERRKRGLAPVGWSRSMYRLAKEHSKKMASAGKLFHSGRYALQGGENVSGGKGRQRPTDFVRSWIKSPAHRAWLLEPKVKTAAVGISSSRRGTYAAWSFSDQSLYKPSFINGKGGLLNRILSVNLSSVIYNAILLLCRSFDSFFDRIISKVLSVAAVIIGIHGFWAYFMRSNIFFMTDETASKLFFVLGMPDQLNFLSELIKWITYESAQSLIIPVLFMIVSLIVIYIITQLITYIFK